MQGVWCQSNPDGLAPLQALLHTRSHIKTEAARLPFSDVFVWNLLSLDALLSRRVEPVNAERAEFVC